MDIIKGGKKEPKDTKGSKKTDDQSDTFNKMVNAIFGTDTFEGINAIFGTDTFEGIDDLFSTIFSESSKETKKPKKKNSKLRVIRGGKPLDKDE